MNNSTLESESRGIVALGVTGSIAAYKAADLTSKLTQAGISVHVLMTQSATKLVQAQTFLTLSQNPVTTDLWDTPDWQPEHIALAEKAQVLIVAPATANFLGKLAHGIADDALSTYALSHSGPVIVAPAMNPRMWQHPAVQDNCRILRERGVVFVEPESGRVACGEEGTGRLASVETLLQTVQVQLAAATLADSAKKPLRILVTAGPTREDLDPVRFLSNRSSGKMGYAVAQVAAAAGCDTTLISGPTALPKPAGCRCIDVVSAADMAEAVKAEFEACDVLVMSAAVADFRSASVEKQKIKKGDNGLELSLVRTEDILASLATMRRPGQKIMGFAAETRDLAAAAQKKLERKKLDWIVANDVSRSDIGFASDQNEVTVFSQSGAQTLSAMPKIELAGHLLKIILAETSDNDD